MEMVAARVKHLSERVLSPEARRQLRAWWLGEVLDERADPVLKNSDQTIAAEAKHSARVSPVSLGEDDVHVLRLFLAELLWGAGNVSPADQEFVTEFALRLGLSSKKGIAFLGVGLGGAAREIADKTGVWITGFEANKAAAKLGAKQCAHEAGGEKISIECVDFETLTLPKKKFSDIICKEALHPVRDKKRLIMEIANSMKAGGTLLIMGPVEIQQPAGAHESARLLPGIWGDLEPVSVAAYASLIKDAGLDLRVNEDITPRYLELVAEGWSKLRRVVDRFTEAKLGKAARSFCLRVIAEEAELWAKRLEAFHDRRLAIHRIAAIKSRP
jgi:SAM-dependent methyltransferase